MRKNILSIFPICLIIFNTYSYSETKNIEIIPKSAAKMFSDIKNLLSTIKQIPSSSLNVENISGHYCTDGPSIIKRLWGALSGSELYLFSDSTYIYLEWADLLPRTIFEKGQWDINDSFILLHSDNSVPKKNTHKYLDSVFLPLIIQNGIKDNIFIMGAENNYSYFIKEVKDDPAFMLLLCGFEKEKTITPAEIEHIKDKLMKESWTPWFFAEGYPPHTLKIDAYAGSDVVAIIKTLSGHQIPIAKGGGIQIKAKVIYPIKGTKSGDELVIYYAAGNLQQEYIANLVWDPKLNGYKYYDGNMDIPVIGIDKSEYSSIQEFMKGWGLEGEPVLIDSNKYYLPICTSECDNKCQRKFEYVQYMLNQIIRK